MIRARDARDVRIVEYSCHEWLLGPVLIGG